MCVGVCPFGAVKPNSSGTVSIKCDACNGMERPFCVEACPTKALAYVDVSGMRRLAMKRAGQIVETLYQQGLGADEATYVKLGYSSRRGGLLR